MKDFFDRTTSCFEEEDAEFRPEPAMFSVKEQIAHAAQTIDWFIDGAFRPEGFNLDFNEIDTRMRRVETLAEARAWFEKAVVRAVQVIGSKSMEELSQPIPEGPILAGAPRSTIVPAMADHTAHHRGALTVYARLRGKIPPMPYGEE